MKYIIAQTSSLLRAAHERSKYFNSTAMLNISWSKSNNGSSFHSNGVNGTIFIYFNLITSKDQNDFFNNDKALMS